MIRHSIDHGVNYVDSAYGYHRGRSEVLVGKALKDGYREKVRVATKMPVRIVEKREHLDEYFKTQLERLDLERIDFYLLHGLRTTTWPKVKRFDILNWAEEKIDEGKINYVGFSFHDNLPLFKEIVEIPLRIVMRSGKILGKKYLDGQGFRQGGYGLLAGPRDGIDLVLGEVQPEEKGNAHTIDQDDDNHTSEESNIVP